MSKTKEAYRLPGGAILNSGAANRIENAGLSTARITIPNGAGGGSGAVEMAISLLAFQEGNLPASLNYEHPDPACPVNVVHGDPRKIEKRGAVLLNQGRDGQALAVVLMAE